MSFFFKSIVIRAINLFLSIIVLKIILNSIGVNFFGEYIAIITLAIIFLIPVQFGISKLLEKEKLNNNELNGLLSIIILLNIGALIIYNYGIFSYRLKASVLIFSTHSLFYVLTSYFKVYVNKKQGVLLENVIIPLTNLCLIIAYYDSLNVEKLALLKSISVLPIILICTFKNKFKKIICSKPSLRLNTRLLLTFSLIGGIQVFMNKLDILMVDFYLPSKEVSVLETSLRIANLSLIPLVALNTYLGIDISKNFIIGDFYKIKELYVKYTKKLIFLGAMSSLFLYVFKSEIIILMFNKDVINAVSIIPILLIGNLISLGVGPASNILKMIDSHNIVLYVSILTVILNIITNILLIPIYGVKGAAFATLIGFAFRSIMLKFFIERKLNDKINL